MKTCFDCKIEKEESQFNGNRLRSDGLQTACRDCNSLRHKQWYIDNKKEVRKRAVEWKEQQHKVLTRFLFEHLQAHPCVDCGNNNLLVLEFDHVRGIKEDAVGHLLQQRVSLEILKSEVEKCEVRCRNCHAIRTQLSNPRSWRRDFILALSSNG